MIKKLNVLLYTRFKIKFKPNTGNFPLSFIFFLGSRINCKVNENRESNADKMNKIFTQLLDIH